MEETNREPGSAHGGHAMQGGGERSEPHPSDASKMSSIRTCHRRLASMHDVCTAISPTRHGWGSLRSPPAYESILRAAFDPSAGSCTHRMTAGSPLRLNGGSKTRPTEKFASLIQTRRAGLDPPYGLDAAVRSRNAAKPTGGSDLAANVAKVSLSADTFTSGLRPSK